MGSQRYRFGVFTFDAETLELKRNDSTVRLQAQPAQVLACLIRHADRIVSREELRVAIWGNDTFVDFERGLNFCISQIRIVLKDFAAQPIYIRTFPRQGYQFIAPIQSYRESDSSLFMGRSQWRLRAVLPLALIIGAMAIGIPFAVRQWKHGQKGAHPPVVAVLRFDNETGRPESTRFSDGLTDAFVERFTALSNGRYAVIGNARILRLSREARDLNAISTQLNADYIVLGQVQAQDSRTRILVHLIRMPEQTHVWVTRMEPLQADLLSIQAEAAEKIAADFSQRLPEGGRMTSPQAVSH